MPAPEKAQLEGLVKMYMQQNELQGEDSPALAAAIADTIAQALQLLTQQTMVQAGISCSPGASMTPGRLM
jgi:hypothetical protein